MGSLCSLCVSFVFVYAKKRFFHDVAQMLPMKTDQVAK